MANSVATAQDGGESCSGSATLMFGFSACQQELAGCSPMAAMLSPATCESAHLESAAKYPVSVGAAQRPSTVGCKRKAGRDQSTPGSAAVPLVDCLDQSGRPSGGTSQAFRCDTQTYACHLVITWVNASLDRIAGMMLAQVALSKLSMILHDQNDCCLPALAAAGKHLVPLMHGWCHSCRPENTKRLHSLQHACSGTVGSAWGTSGSCHSECDLASLLDMQNASPVADNAGKIPARPDVASGPVQRRSPLRQVSTGLRVTLHPFCASRLLREHPAMRAFWGPCVHLGAVADMMSGHYLSAQQCVRRPFSCRLLLKDGS